MTYLLEKEDLISVLEINNINTYCGDGNAIENFNESISSNFLDNAILSQPELLEIKNNFIKEVNNFSSLKKSDFRTVIKFFEVFSDVFDKKIKITSLKDCYFKNIVRIDDSVRKKLFLKLDKNSDLFLPIIYDEMRNSNTRQDSIVYESYLHILRANKNNLSNLDSQEILKSIKKFDTYFSTNLSKKKINTYITLFDKNQTLYNFVMSDMGDLFKKSALLNNYWESKLGGFEKGTVFQNEESVLKFEEEKSFFYSFRLSPEWVIKEQKISEKQARLFCISFKRVLQSVMDESFDVNFINTNINEASALNMTTKTEEESIIIKKFFNDLVKYMPTLFETFNHNSDLSSQIEQMQQYVSNLNKYKMSDVLNKELEMKSIKLNSLKI